MGACITHAGDGTHRLFVCDQRGVIHLIKNGIRQPVPFMDVSSLLVAERAASAEITSLYTEYVRRRLAAAAFEDALPAATDNEQLSQRSFEEGELSLPDLVVVRREVIETRLEYLDLLFEAAETAVARDAAAGVMK